LLSFLYILSHSPSSLYLPLSPSYLFYITTLYTHASCIPLVCTFFLPYPPYLHSTVVLLMFSYSIQSLKLFICYSTLFFYLFLHIQRLIFFSFIPAFHILLLIVIHLLYTLFPVHSQSTFAQTKPTQFCSLWSLTSAPVQIPEIIWSHHPLKKSLVLTEQDAQNMAHPTISLTLLSVRFFQNKNLNDLKLIGMRFKSEGLQPWTTLRGELAAKTAVTSDRAFSVDRRTHTHSSCNPQMPRSSRILW